MLITEFYKNKELFVTGGSGYLGKSFIEKLLRDCPGVSKVYFLIRSKKNKTPLERMKEFSTDLLFERLHREQPNAFDKIVPIIGDTCELGLGINAKDLDLLKNVNIIIHCAANVRFDNTLRNYILMNTRGTHELLKIALTLKNLIAFIHMSTAYVNPFESYIKEEIYDATVNWRSAIKAAETLDDEILDILRIKYTKYPNAYSFSKNLSENVVAEFSDKLPITILRPSIVVHSIKEPEPGFIDNLNGPMGILVIMATGIAQVAYANGDLMMAFIPVDAVSNLTIIAAYRRGLETINCKNNDLDIRNLTAGKVYEGTLKQGWHLFKMHVDKEPFEQSIWAPNSYFSDNFYLFIACIFFVNIPMALIYDALLRLSKKETIAMKLTRKLVFTLKAIGKFSHKYFDFQNDGMWELIKMIPEEEKEKFENDFITDRIDAFESTMHLRDGVKKYILKQPLKATSATRYRHKLLIIIDKILKVLIFFLLVIFLWKKFN